MAISKDFFELSILFCLLFVGFSSLFSIVNIMPNFVGKYSFGIEQTLLLSLACIIFNICFFYIILYLTIIEDKNKKREED